MAFIAEAAEFGIYTNSDDLRKKMGALMYNKPIGDEYALFAAAARGAKDSVGALVYKESDFEPGET